MHPNFVRQLERDQESQLQTVNVPPGMLYVASVDKPLAEMPDGRQIVLSLEWGDRQDETPSNDYPETWIAHDIVEGRYKITHPLAVLNEDGPELWHNRAPWPVTMREHTLIPGVRVSLNRDGGDFGFSEAAINTTNLGSFVTGIFTGFRKIAEIQLSDNRHVIVKNVLPKRTQTSLRLTNAS